jgi:hypothetical protein
MIKREDRLKELLSGKIITNEPKWPEEINIWGSISPVAKIKVVW